MRTDWSPVSLKHQTFDVTNQKYVIGIYSRLDAAVHAENSCFLLRQITAYYFHMSIAVLPDIHFEGECDTYKCVQ